MFYGKNKKTSVILAILGLVALIIFFLSRWGGGEKSPETLFNQNPLFPRLPAQTAEQLQDDDGDGLQNWEEAIYRTNPKNSDTDGDSAPDGEEIRQNRDPLKAGPDDKIAKTAKANTGGEEKTSDNLTENLTAIFIKKYLGESLAGKAPTDPQIASQIILNEFLASAPAKISFPVIKSGEVKISENDSPEAIKKYLNDVAAIVNKNLSGLPDPLVVLAEALKKTNTDIFDPNRPFPEEFSQSLESFNLLISRHRAVSEEMKKIPAPPSLKNRQEKFLNALLKFTSILEVFRNTERDPIKTLYYSLNPYQETVMEFAKILEETKTEVKKRGIVFGENEPAKQILQF